MQTQEDDEVLVCVRIPVGAGARVLGTQWRREDVVAEILKFVYGGGGGPFLCEWIITVCHVLSFVRRTVSLPLLVLLLLLVLFLRTVLLSTAAAAAAAPVVLRSGCPQEYTAC